MKKDIYITWKANQQGKDYLLAKRYELAKEESEQREEMWRYRIEK
jgi:hypothetical protein